MYTRPFERRLHTDRSSALIVETPVHRRPVPVVPLALQYAKISATEARVAQRVAHRIYRRIDVAQVIEKVPDVRRYRLAERERLQQHEDVVRRPGDDEREQDRGQGFGRLLVRLLLLGLLLALAQARLGRIHQNLHRKADVGKSRPAPLPLRKTY